MKRFAASALLSACTLLVSAAALAASGESDRSPARTRMFAQLAGHSLLQIVLVVPKGRTNLARSAQQGWALAGNVVCIDAGPLREAIDMREFDELPADARTSAIAGEEFYRAVRHDPPRLLPHDRDDDFGADLNAALTRFVTAKVSKKVVLEFNHGGATCPPDVFAVPAIRFHKKVSTRPAKDSWLDRMERGAIVVLGMVTTSELRAARAQRLAVLAADAKAGGDRTGTGRTASAALDQTYGALRVNDGRFKTCYAANEDPLLALVAWTVAESDVVKRWMNAVPDAPKMLADLDTIVAEMRKPPASRQCTVIVAATPVLAKVKATLERDGFAVSVYPETCSGHQVLAAFGFRSVGELQFARELGIDSGERFAPLRELGLDTREGYESALKRYSWIFGAAKPDAETLAAFVRDEREAAARGVTVKALRAERAKREHDKAAKTTAAAAARQR